MALIAALITAGTLISGAPAQEVCQPGAQCKNGKVCMQLMDDMGSPLSWLEHGNFWDITNQKPWAGDKATHFCTDTKDAATTIKTVGCEKVNLHCAFTEIDVEEQYINGHMEAVKHCITKHCPKSAQQPPSAPSTQKTLSLPSTQIAGQSSIFPRVEQPASTQLDPFSTPSNFENAAPRASPFQTPTMSNDPFSLYSPDAYNAPNPFGGIPQLRGVSQPGAIPQPGAGFQPAASWANPGAIPGGTVRLASLPGNAGVWSGDTVFGAVAFVAVGGALGAVVARVMDLKRRKSMLTSSGMLG